MEGFIKGKAIEIQGRDDVQEECANVSLEEREKLQRKRERERESID